MLYWLSLDQRAPRATVFVCYTDNFASVSVHMAVQAACGAHKTHSVYSTAHLACKAQCTGTLQQPAVGAFTPSLGPGMCTFHAQLTAILQEGCLSVSAPTQHDIMCSICHAA